jgi:outer membrane receptor protein involved in Fe transport
LRATLSLQNVFNDRQKVVNDAGVVPQAYQPGYLDPTGRTVMLTVRKIQ